METPYFGVHETRGKRMGILSIVPQDRERLVCQADARSHPKRTQFNRRGRRGGRAEGLWVAIPVDQ